VAGFYNAPGGLVPLFWIPLVFSFFAIDVIFTALGGELFPTAVRSTGSALRAISFTLGGALGLLTEGFLFEATGSHAAAITWMLTSVAVAAVAVARWLPETARRSLEEIAPDTGRVEP
jgi:hypothetical protein